MSVRRSSPSIPHRAIRPRAGIIAVRKAKPTPGWKAAILRMRGWTNPRTPSVPVTLELSFDEYFTASALILAPCRHRVKEPDPRKHAAGAHADDERSRDQLGERRHSVRWRRAVISVLTAAILAACGSNGGGSPTQPAASTPTTFSLSGTLTDGQTGRGISGARAVIADGPNANRSATADGSGHYSFSGLTQSGFTVNFTAQYYNPTSQGVTLTSNQTVNATLSPIPLFTVSGSGDNVFTIPLTVTRIHIVANYPGFSSNFIVHIAGNGVVNELMGTAWNETHFEGTYVTSGGTVEILHSSGVAWSFTEVR